MYKLGKYSCFLFFLFASLAYGQVNFFDFTIFEPLPSVDIGAFMTINGLQNNQKIFLVTISGSGMVELNGLIEWKDVNASSFKSIYQFTTKPFAARNFYNTDIGNSSISIGEKSSDSDALKELTNKGKPVGEFRFTLKLLKADGSLYTEIPQPAPKTISFLNPAQTITILSPAENSVQDAGNVIAIWTPVAGATEYTIKAGIRTSSSQSFEEALSSGSPLINNKSAGNVTSHDLRSLLDREWTAGQEIVMQVTAIIPGPSGGQTLLSNIVNFSLNSNNLDSTKPGTTGSAFNHNNPLKLQLMNINNGNLRQALAASGKILKIIGPDGSELSAADLDAILKYLQENPESIIEITTENKQE